MGLIFKFEYGEYRWLCFKSFSIWSHDRVLEMIGNFIKDIYFTMKILYNRNKDEQKKGEIK